MTAGRRKRDPLDRYDTPQEDVQRFLRAWLAELSPNLYTATWRVWEPAAGSGSIVAALREALPGAWIMGSDIAPRGAAVVQLDFFGSTMIQGWDLIITNPPYRLAEQFVRHAHKLVRDGGFVVMLLRAAFLEARARRAFWQEFPPSQVFFLERRPRFRGPNTDGGTDTAMYAWFVWRRLPQGPRAFEGYRI